MTTKVGPAPQEHRALAKALKDNGVPEKRLPPFLRDGVVAKSKKDALGQLAVRNMSGMVVNTTQRVVSRFEESAGGRENIIEKLEAVQDQLREPEQKLLALMHEADEKKSLGRLIAESGASAVRIMKLFVEGTRVLGETEALIMVGAHQPAIIKDLIRHAIDSPTICEVCVGLGKVKKFKGAMEDSQLCPQCKGTGQSLVSSEHKEFAMEHLLKMTKLEPKEKGGPLVNVQQNVGVKVGGNGNSFMEKMLHTSDEILYGKPASVIEAEIVQPEDHSAE